MKFKKIFITGPNGFIGNNLIKSLIENENINLSVLIRKKEYFDLFEPYGISCFLDDGSTDDLIKYFNEQKFDLVIHLASLFIKDHNSNNIVNLIESNVLLGTRLLEASVKSGVKAFINTGTFWQHYSGEEYSPVNLYAATKQAFEDIAKYYIESNNLYFVTLKLNDTYGPDDTRKKIFNIWHSLNNNERLKMSPGLQKIDILFIDDVVEAFKKLILQVEDDFIDKKYNGKTFAIHSLQLHSLQEIAEIYEEVSGNKLNIEWGGLNYREREVMEPWKGGEIINGWKSEVSIRDGIKKLVNHQHSKK